MRQRGSVVLGSASPRRMELLERLGVVFTVWPVDLDEDSIGGDVTAPEFALRVARAKFAAVADALADAGGQEPSIMATAGGRAVPPIVVTADTVVAVGGDIVGKPRDPIHAKRMLASMSGREVQIVTAVCAGSSTAAPRNRTVETRVRLRCLTAADLDMYLATGEAFDKAGGLALQGAANGFVAAVDGCWTNVIGLPLCAVVELLEPTGFHAISTGTDALGARGCSTVGCRLDGQDEPD